MLIFSVPPPPLLCDWDNNENKKRSKFELMLKIWKEQQQVFAFPMLFRLKKTRPIFLAGCNHNVFL